MRSLVRLVLVDGAYGLGVPAAEVDLLLCDAPQAFRFDDVLHGVSEELGLFEAKKVKAESLFGQNAEEGHEFELDVQALFPREDVLSGSACQRAHDSVAEARVSLGPVVSEKHFEESRLRLSRHNQQV